MEGTRHNERNNNRILVLQGCDSANSKQSSVNPPLGVVAPDDMIAGYMMREARSYLFHAIPGRRCSPWRTPRRLEWDSCFVALYEFLGLS